MMAQAKPLALPKAQKAAMVKHLVEKHGVSQDWANDPAHHQDGVSLAAQHAQSHKSNPWGVGGSQQFRHYHSELDAPQMTARGKDV